MQGQVEGGLPDYRIFETDEFQRNLEKLPARDRESIQGKLTHYTYPRQREQPFWGTNIRKLRGYPTDTWRYRIGRYRIFCAVDEDERPVYVLTAYTASLEVVGRLIHLQPLQPARGQFELCGLQLPGD